MCWTRGNLAHSLSPRRFKKPQSAGHSNLERIGTLVKIQPDTMDVNSIGQRSGVRYAMVSHDYDLTVELILQMAAQPSCSAQVQCTYCRRGRPAFFLISISPFARLSLAQTNCTTFMYCLQSTKPQGMHRRVQGTRVFHLVCSVSSVSGYLYTSEWDQ